MRDGTYNGWTNRETWLVGLWDITDYDTEDLAAYRGNPYGLASEIESHVDEVVEFSGAEASGFVGDLLSGALARINYYELAETLLADLPDVEADEED